MSDMREMIHKPDLAPDHKIFLLYHQNTPWARAKVEAGVRLTPESVAYMQQELDSRALRKKLYDEQLAKDKGHEAQPATSDIPADSAGEQLSPAAGVRGPDSDTPAGG